MVLRQFPALTSSIIADRYQNDSTSLPIYSLAFRTLSTAFPQPMKIKQQQLERLVSALLTNYHAKELIHPKAAEPELKARIIAVISQNFAEEEAIEDEARKMLASYAHVARDMDPYKMFLIAKQKLAAKKGFIL
jgi:Protein of unknown function (DUF507)